MRRKDAVEAIEKALDTYVETVRKEGATPLEAEQYLAAIFMEYRYRHFNIQYTAQDPQ